MKDIFEEIGKVLSETAETVSNKAGEVVETQRIRSQMNTLKRSNTRDFKDMGLLIYEKFKNGEVIDLTQVEYQIMELFLKNQNVALDRNQILTEIWGDNYYGDIKIVDVNIRRLRMKVEEEPSNPKYIYTVWGYGYKWCGAAE